MLHSPFTRDELDRYAAVALRCLKAPITLMAFPAADADAGAGDRGFALEALWGGTGG